MCERYNAERILKIMEFAVGTWFHVGEENPRWGREFHASDNRFILATLILVTPWKQTENYKIQCSSWLQLTEARRFNKLLGELGPADHKHVASIPSLQRLSLIHI